MSCRLQAGGLASGAFQFQPESLRIAGATSVSLGLGPKAQDSEVLMS